MVLIHLLRAFLVCAISAIPLLVTAAPVQVSSRAALAGNDYFDWADAGAVQSQPANGFLLLSNGSNVTLTASTVNDDNLRLLPDITIGFPSGDGMILEVGLTDNGGPLSISFDTPVFGAGAQINAAFGNVPMIAQLKLFNLANELLATLTTGTVDSLSEPFLGATDTLGISRIEFDIISLFGTTSSNRFAINQLDIVARPPVLQPGTVPEPGTLLLVGLSAVLLALARRRPAR